MCTDDMVSTEVIVCPCIVVQCMKMCSFVRGMHTCVGNTVCTLTHLNFAALEVTATITMLAVIKRALNLASFVSISADILGGNF